MKNLKVLVALFIGLFFLISMAMAQKVVTGKEVVIDEEKPSQDSRVSTQNTKEKGEEPYINYLEGEVFFQKSEKAQTEMIINQGDELLSKNGRAEIYLGNGNWLKMDENSKVFFSNLQNPIRISLLQGSIHLDLKEKIEVWSLKEVLSPEPGEYRMDLENEKIRDYPNPRVADDFDKWNREREKETGLAESDYQEKTTKVERYHYGIYPIWSWYVCWHPCWYPIWYNWYWYSPFYYSYWYYPPRFHNDYWDSGRYGYQYSQYSGHRTISTNQLRNPVSKSRSLSVNHSFQSAESQAQSHNSVPTRRFISKDSYSTSLKSYPSRLSQSSPRSSVSSNPLRRLIDSPRQFSNRSAKADRSYPPKSRSYSRSSGSSRPSMQSRSSGLYRSSGYSRSSGSSRSSGHSSGSIRKK